ncbi:MAG: HAD hydrolase family protein [Planctomycetes bacterium]|nr:HAD hydrolase family protein [Planctomycetota bacterium]
MPAKKTGKQTSTKVRQAKLTAPAREEWAGIKLVATDVDGVMTDGTVLYGAQGELAKNFFIHDGMGLRLLEAAGIRVCVITSEDSQLVHQRVSRLMLSAYKPGMKRKGEALKSLMTSYGVIRQQTVYIGDDVNDAEALEAAGIGVCPPEASKSARDRARYTTKAPGGRGALREVADLILEAKGLDPVTLWRSIHPDVSSSGNKV